jgi:hypothetical protein
MAGIKMVLLAFTVTTVFSSQAHAIEGYEILFKGTSSKLSNREKSQIYNKLGLRLSKDKKAVIDSVCGQDASPTVKIEDLNGDGAEEVFVIWGNTCTSGQAGQSISLFIKSANGAYVDNFGFPGIDYEKMKTGNKGYPDLMIGGPGFCHPVWRWNGRQYQHFRNQPEVKGGCDGVHK